MGAGTKGEGNRRAALLLVLSAACTALLLFAPRANADLYWAGFNLGVNGTQLGKADTSGAIIADPFVATADDPCGVVSDGTHVYWTNWANGGTPSIGRVDVDGTNPI